MLSVLLITTGVIICCSYGLGRVNSLKISYNEHEYDWQFCSILSKNNAEIYEIGCEKYMNTLCLDNSLEICKLRKNMLNIIECQYNYTWIMAILLSIAVLISLIEIIDFVRHIIANYCTKHTESEENLLENTA
jgi:hypothetical protein